MNPYIAGFLGGALFGVCLAYALLIVLIYVADRFRSPRHAGEASVRGSAEETLVSRGAE